MAFKIIFFVLATMLIVWVSRRSLLQVRHHGFYRFLAWQTILVAFMLNVDYWFVNPFSFTQILAWGLLILSLVPLILGVQAFRKEGEIDPARLDPGLVGIEKTTQLVTTGIYGLIRHPFYTSLLLLNWGIFFKDTTGPSLVLAVLATVFLTITAKVEETENVQFFGEDYSDYMHDTKMFIPFVI